jgi:hypothetical protein
MAGVTYFVQECPTCGRRLQVRIVDLGKRVACCHCSASFTACDPQSPDHPPAGSGLDLQTRVDQLLEASTSRAGVPSSGL